MNKIQQLEQMRANFAWKDVSVIDKNKNINSKFKKEYRSIIMKLPTLILTNGLGQTLAFLKAKGKGDDRTPEEVIYKCLQEWLFSSLDWGSFQQGEIIERVISADNYKYRLATMEALAFLNWLKRFADGVLSE